MRGLNSSLPPWAGLALVVLAACALCRAYPDGRVAYESPEPRPDEQVDLGSLESTSTPSQSTDPTEQQEPVTEPWRPTKRDVSNPFRTLEVVKTREAREAPSVDNDSDEEDSGSNDESNAEDDNKSLEDRSDKHRLPLEEDDNSEIHRALKNFNNTLAFLKSTSSVQPTASNSSGFWENVAQRISQFNVPQPIRSILGLPANDMLQIGEHATTRQARETPAPSLPSTYISHMIQPFLPDTVTPEQKKEMHGHVNDATCELQNLVGQIRTACSNIREGFSGAAPANSYNQPPGTSYNNPLFQSAPALIQNIMEHPEQLGQLPEVLESVPSNQMTNSVEKIKDSFTKMFGMIHKFEEREDSDYQDDSKELKGNGKKKYDKIFKRFDGTKSKKSRKNGDDYEPEVPKTIILSIPTLMPQTSAYPDYSSNPAYQYNTAYPSNVAYPAAYPSSAVYTPYRYQAQVNYPSYSMYPSYSENVAFSGIHAKPVYTTSGGLYSSATTVPPVLPTRLSIPQINAPQILDDHVEIKPNYEAHNLPPADSLSSASSLSLSSIQSVPQLNQAESMSTVPSSDMNAPLNVPSEPQLTSMHGSNAPYYQSSIASESYPAASQPESYHNLNAKPHLPQDSYNQPSPNYFTPLPGSQYINPTKTYQKPPSEDSPSQYSNNPEHQKYKSFEVPKEKGKLLIPRHITESSYGSSESTSRSEPPRFNSKFRELRRQAPRINPSRFHSSKVKQLYIGDQPFNTRLSLNSRVQSAPMASLKIDHSSNDGCVCNDAQCESDARTSSMSLQSNFEKPTGFLKPNNFNQEHGFQQMHNNRHDFPPQNNNPNERAQNDFTQAFNQDDSSNSFAQSEYLNSLSQSRLASTPVQQGFPNAASHAQFIDNFSQNGQPQVNSESLFSASQSQSGFINNPLQNFESGQQEQSNMHQRIRQQNKHNGMNNQANQAPVFEMGSIQGNNRFRLANEDSNAASFPNMHNGGTVGSNAAPHFNQFNDGSSGLNTVSHLNNKHNSPDKIFSVRKPPQSASLVVDSTPSESCLNPSVVSLSESSSHTGSSNHLVPERPENHGVRFADSINIASSNINSVNHVQENSFGGIGPVSDTLPGSSFNEAAALHISSSDSMNEPEIFNRDSPSSSSVRAESLQTPLLGSVSETQSQNSNSPDFSSDRAQTSRSFPHNGQYRRGHLNTAESHVDSSPNDFPAETGVRLISPHNSQHGQGHLNTAKSHSFASPGHSSSEAEALMTSSQGVPNRLGHLNIANSHNNASPDFSSDRTQTSHSFSHDVQNKHGHLNVAESHVNTSPNDFSTDAEARLISPHRQGHLNNAKSNSFASPGHSSEAKSAHIFSLDSPHTQNHLNMANSHNNASPDFSSDRAQTSHSFPHNVQNRHGHLNTAESHVDSSPNDFPIEAEARFISPHNSQLGQGHLNIAKSHSFPSPGHSSSEAEALMSSSQGVPNRLGHLNTAKSHNIDSSDCSSGDAETEKISSHGSTDRQGHLNIAESHVNTSPNDFSTETKAKLISSQDSPHKQDHLNIARSHSFASPGHSSSEAEASSTSSQGAPNQPGHSNIAEFHANTLPGHSSNGVEISQISSLNSPHESDRSSQSEFDRNASPNFSSSRVVALNTSPNWFSKTESLNQNSPDSSASAAEAAEISSPDSSGKVPHQILPDSSSSKSDSFSISSPSNFDPDKMGDGSSPRAVFINPHQEPNLHFTQNTDKLPLEGFNNAGVPPDFLSQSSSDTFNGKIPTNEFNNADNGFSEASSLNVITNNGNNNFDVTSANSATKFLNPESFGAFEPPCHEKPLEKLKTVVSGIVEAIAESCACSTCHEGKSPDHVPHKVDESSSQPASITPGALLPPVEQSPSDLQSNWDPASQPNSFYHETLGSESSSGMNVTPEKTETTSCSSSSQKEESPLAKLKDAVMEVISSTVTKSDSENSEDESLDVLGCIASAIVETMNEATSNQSEGGGCPAVAFGNAASAVLGSLSDMVPAKPHESTNQHEPHNQYEPNKQHEPNKSHEPNKPQSYPFDCITETASIISDKIVSAVSLINSRNQLRHHKGHEPSSIQNIINPITDTAKSVVESLPISQNSNPLIPAVDNVAYTINSLTSHLSNNPVDSGTPTHTLSNPLTARNNMPIGNSGSSIATSTKDLANSLSSVLLQLAPQYPQSYVTPNYISPSARLSPSQNILMYGHPNQCSCQKDVPVTGRHIPPNNFYSISLKPQLQ